MLTGPRTNGFCRRKVVSSMSLSIRKCAKKTGGYITNLEFSNLGIKLCPYGKAPETRLRLASLAVSKIIIVIPTRTSTCIQSSGETWRNRGSGWEICDAGVISIRQTVDRCKIGRRRALIRENIGVIFWGNRRCGLRNKACSLPYGPKIVTYPKSS